jgi:tetratricopeptide (TPR) repeat protein
MQLRLAAAVCCLLIAVTARAQVSTEGLSGAEIEQRSRAHFELARAHLQLREYDAAIREFEIGYQFKPLPLFLYNIAQVAVLENKRSMAVEYFQRYLQASPRAPERADVNRRLDELKRSLAANPEPPPPPDEPTPAPTAVAANPAAAVDSGADLSTTRSAPPPKKKSNKGWIALGVIGGVLVIGAAVAIGVTQSVHNDSGYNDWGTLVVNGRR